MFTTLKLWWIKRQIRHMEFHEHELKERLKHVQNSILPDLRTKRNAILYPVQSTKGPQKWTRARLQQR